MRDLGQWIGLVHELRKLRSAKKLFQRRRNWLAVDQVMRHQRLLLGLPQTLLDGLLNPCKSCAVLVFSQFADATNAAIAQVVDVIDLTTTIAQVNQNFYN